MNLLHKKVRKVLIILFVISLTGCFQSTKSLLIINNVSRDTSILIKVINPRLYSPTNMIVKITGETSDSFIVMNGMKIPGGIVDTLMNMDFYNHECLFKYNSYKAKKGQLKVSIEIP
jgi:hypothetical protein